MCRGNNNTNEVQEQKTSNTQVDIFHTNLMENEPGMTRTVPEQPPVPETKNTGEADRLERIKQIQIQPVPELKIPEKSLFDDYTASYQVRGQGLKTVKVKKQEYADRYNEKSISENKRAGRTKDPTSRLYRKAENARQIEDAGETEQGREIRLLKNASKDLTLRMKEEDTLMLTKLMSGDAAHDKALLERYTGDKTAKDELLLQLLEEFLQMDLTGYDLSNEEAIAGNAAGFEALSARVEAMLMLVEKNPAFFDALPDNVKETFKTQRTNAMMVVSYYRITKMIVTDPYYRTHYNSEVSRQWSPTDPPAKQRLTRLLWMRTSAATHAFNFKFWKDKPMVIALKDTGAAKKKYGKYRDQYQDILGGDGEYAKSGDYSDETNPHFDFFRNLEQNDPELFEKMTRNRPGIAGTNIEMAEALVRTSTRALEGMRGIRGMTQAQLMQMLNDIYAEPEEGATPEETEQVKQRNLAGYRQYKKLVAEQLEYIGRKYPFLFEFASPDELVEHKDEIQDDLCMIQVMDKFLTMIRNVPELFDPNDPNDLNMHITMNSLLFVHATERFAGSSLDPRGQGALNTMTGKRMGHAMEVVMYGINNSSYSFIKLLDKLENGDVETRWGEDIAYEPLTAGEPVLVSKTLEKMERRSVRKSRAKEAARAAAALKDQDFSTGMGSPKTSNLMKHVKSQYFEVDKRMKEPIPEDQNLFNDAVNEIEHCYIDLIRSCRVYEEKRNPRTDLGKQRKEMVQTIRNNALREMDIFHIKAREYFESGKGGTFGDVIGDFQRTQAMLNGQL